VISQVRQVILDNLPEGYQETMNWGMISYEIPLERYPVTYNKKPLSYIGLAAQKNNYSLYLMGVYQDPEQEALLVDGFQQAGKRLDMGKSCVRFRRLDDLPLDVIAEIVGAISVEQYIERYELSRKT
jgi:hypothetical protein